MRGSKQAKKESEEACSLRTSQADRRRSCLDVNDCSECKSELLTIQIKTQDASAQRVEFGLKPLNPLKPASEAKEDEEILLLETSCSSIRDEATLKES